MTSDYPAAGRARVLVVASVADLAELTRAAARAGTDRSRYLAEAGLARARGEAIVVAPEIRALLGEVERRLGVAPERALEMVVAAGVGALVGEAPR